MAALQARPVVVQTRRAPASERPASTLSLAFPGFRGWLTAARRGGHVWGVMQRRHGIAEKQRAAEAAVMARSRREILRFNFWGSAAPLPPSAAAAAGGSPGMSGFSVGCTKQLPGGWHGC